MSNHVHTQTIPDAHQYARPESTDALDRTPPNNYPLHMPPFTRENAAILGQKGAIARWSKPKPEPPIAIPTPMPVIIAEPADDFANRRLKRVREQLDRIDALASEETEPKALKEYADATTRLSEQERVLAGRPLPGSRRPAQDRNPRQDAGAWITEPTEAPAPSPAPSPAAPACGVDTPPSPISPPDLTTPQSWETAHKGA